MAIPLSPRRRRLSVGPALGHASLPVTATVVSAIVHGALAAAVIIGAGVWTARQPKTYVINLVPAVAATGSPEARPAPARPLRPDPVAPRAPATAPATATRPPDLPVRETPPQMPTRATATTSGLPDRTPPSRAPALPRAGDKELPTVPSTPTTKPVPVPPAPPRPETAAAPTPPRPETAAAPPPPPLGRPSGSALGSGAVTMNVSDFPFAWYLSAIHRKVTAEWSARALEGRQPVAVFEIGRNGQVTKLSIEKSSGNPYYDQAALRAITGANPFPPLPEEFKEPFLRIHLGFNFASERG